MVTPGSTGFPQQGQVLGNFGANPLKTTRASPLGPVLVCIVAFSDMIVPFG
jgi:hypothetical protein